jgi:hypothetical protein
MYRDAFTMSTNSFQGAGSARAKILGGCQAGEASGQEQPPTLVVLFCNDRYSGEGKRKDGGRDAIGIGTAAGRGSSRQGRLDHRIRGEEAADKNRAEPEKNGSRARSPHRSVHGP